MKPTRPPQRISIGLIQRRCGPDPDRNLQATIRAIHRAASQGARIICTQELFETPYFCQREDHDHFRLAQTIPGSTTEILRDVARQLEVVLIASIFERRTAGVFHNAAVVLDADGGLCGLYRKMHIPDDPGFSEKFYFTPGDLGFPAFDTAYARVGVLICWDQWYPEAARLTALHGAQIIFCPTAIGWLPSEKPALGPTQHAAWETIQRSHAIANGCYLASVNRVGVECPYGGEGVEFWGQSFVAGTFGQILARAAPDAEETMVVELDLKDLETTRTHWPFLRDRRIDAYQGISKRVLDV